MYDKLLFVIATKDKMLKNKLNKKFEKKIGMLGLLSGLSLLLRA